MDPALVDAGVSDRGCCDLKAPSFVIEVDELVVLGRDEVPVLVPIDLWRRDSKRRTVQAS